eukprot:5699537-Karenia_brevis.AAC.1
MAYCSNLISRRVGGNSGAILRLWQREIGVLLAMRRARMAKKCMPRMDSDAWFAVHGSRNAGENNGPTWLEDDE